MHHIMLSALVPILLYQGSLSAQLSEKWGVPSSPTGQTIAVILEMIERGDEEFTVEMLDAHFSDAFVASKPMDDHVSLFRELHDDLLEVRPAGIMRTEEGATFRARSPTSETTVSFGLQVDAHGRIASLLVDPGSGGPAEADPEASLPDLLEEWAARGEFSGVVFDSRDGRPVFARAYGLADRRYGLPNTMETAFNIGSLNKLFTGAAVLLLEEDGKVELDAPLGDYLDGFPDDVARKVTIRHLLQHRSGWGHYWDNETFLAHLGEMRALPDYLAFIRDIPLGFEPDTDRLYSNIGYEVLGSVIETVSGMSYYNFIQERLFDPLGMTRTSFPTNDYPTPGLAIGYTKEHPDAVEDGYSMENTFLLAPRGTAAGGAYSTVEDLQRFFLGLVDGRILDDRGLSMTLGGYGEATGVPKGVTVRAGGGPGIRAVVLFDPQARRLAAVLSNYDTDLISQIIERLESAR